MRGKASFKPGRSMVFAAVAALVPLAVHAGNPMGYDTPASGTRGASSAMPGDREAAAPAAPSPLGFELPAITPRGAAGPLRSDPFAEPDVDRELRFLGGIGGRDTN